MHTDTEQYRSIQALRAIAAFMVVMAHAAKDFHTLKVPGHEFITQFQRGGLFGVDLFFCISGFIIFLTTHNRAGNLNASLKSFAHKRFFADLSQLLDGQPHLHQPLCYRLGAEF